MLHKWFFGIAFLIFSTSAFAQDTCTRIKGSWYGTFTLKDVHDCHLYHGCTHQLYIHVNKVDNTSYLAEVKPKIGPAGTFKFTCTNGTLAAPAYPDDFLELNCPDSKVCIVKFDDIKLSASVIGAGVD